MNSPHPKSLSLGRGTSRPNLKMGLAVLCLIAAGMIVLTAGLPDKAQVNSLGVIGAGGLPVAPELGGIAPSLDGVHTDGTALVVARGQPIIVNFWATWCGPCIAELPALQTAYDANHVTGLQIIAVNMGEATDAVTAWQQNFRLNFDVLIDPQRRLFERYRVRGAPSTYFIDRRGIIWHITYGALTDSELRDAIAEISAR